MAAIAGWELSRSWWRGPLPDGLTAHALLLMLPAVLAARLAGPRAGEGSPRLAQGFILAALITLPQPAALLAALAGALAAGHGGAVAGIRLRLPAGLASLLVAVAAAELCVRALGVSGTTADWGLLGCLALLYLIVQGLALAVGRVLAPPHLLGTGAAEPARRVLATELINVPLAWVLTLLHRESRWGPALALTLLVMLALCTLSRLQRSLGRFRDTDQALAARLTELGTLHVIGREILSSMEPARVFGALDRECRKIFDVDSFIVALGDRGDASPQSAYLHLSGHAPEVAARPLPRGLVHWVIEHARAHRVDDFQHQPAGSSLGADRIDPASRSAMAAPLIVEERVIGVLAVHSRRPAAYDEHQLSVLTTIAQQAAAAIERARHYHMATVDGLTGFFLREYFFRRLDQEHSRARRYGGDLALLMVDVDVFKQVNDENGHLAGDQVLREISATIRDQLRVADLPCRYGGDEFCLLLPQTDLLGAWMIGERIRSAIAGRVVRLEQGDLRATVSIGVAATAQSSKATLRDLVRHADEALYRAKRSGRDRVVRFAA